MWRVPALGGCGQVMGKVPALRLLCWVPWGFMGMLHMFSLVDLLMLLEVSEAGPTSPTPGIKPAPD